VYGLPDVGIVGLRDFVDHARHLAARCTIPIFADADTGFGNAVSVHFMVQEYLRAGVAGLHIEDQEAPKKSGTSAGRRCISVAEAVGKYRAAVAARDALDPDFVICARCDFLGAEGGSFEGAVERCIAYVEQGGVDFVWINTLQTRDLIATACARIPAPVLPVYGGPPPAPTLEEWQALGAAAAIFPTLTTTIALQTTWDLLHDFKTRGTTALGEARQRAARSPWGAADLAALVDAEQIREMERRYLPDDLRRDYHGTFGYSTRPGG
jgi:2-methylisocitrate lyase-like PEP mutase family enzyme